MTTKAFGSLNPPPIGWWKRRRNCSVGAGRTKPQRRGVDGAVYEAIGRLKAEVNWLKKNFEPSACGHARMDRDRTPMAIDRGAMPLLRFHNLNLPGRHISCFRNSGNVVQSLIVEEQSCRESRPSHFLENPPAFSVVRWLPQRRMSLAAHGVFKSLLT